MVMWLFEHNLIDIMIMWSYQQTTSARCKPIQSHTNQSNHVTGMGVSSACWKIFEPKSFGAQTHIPACRPPPPARRRPPPGTRRPPPTRLEPRKNKSQMEWFFNLSFRQLIKISISSCIELIFLRYHSVTPTAILGALSANPNHITSHHITSCLERISADPITSHFTPYCLAVLFSTSTTNTINCLEQIGFGV